MYLKGRIAVLKDDTGEYYAVDNASEDELRDSELKTVWKDGFFTSFTSFDKVRANARG